MPRYIDRVFDFKDKVAVVIGGAGHLCGEMAAALAKAGVSIVVLDKSEKKLVGMLTKIKKIHRLESPRVSDKSPCVPSRALCVCLVL